MQTNIIIIGATSAIAQEVAKRYASEKNNAIFLVGRNSTRIENIADDLRVRGKSNIYTYALDMTETNKHSDLLEAIKITLPRIDILFIAYGFLPNQKECEGSYSKAFDAINTNFLSVLSFLTLVANDYETQKTGGRVAIITSIAGDRGRQSNYIYGTAKGALNIYLQGLRNRLVKSKSGVTVTTIKLGFVDTPMTKDFKKGLLWVTPKFVAKLIVNAIAKKKTTVYIPGFWQYIMWIIKLIPEKIFIRLSL
jgi:short-subunit dehydrogenase